MLHALDHRERFDGSTNSFGAMAASRRDDLPPDDRMQMVVLVHVDVIQLQTRGAKSRELRVDLVAQLRPQPPRSDKIEAQPNEIAAHLTRPIDKPRNLFGGQHRLCVDHDQMQAHPQLGQTPCACDRVGRRRPRHHQACRAEDTAAMRDLHSFIDLLGQAEIVGGYDQLTRPAVRQVRNVSHLSQTCSNSAFGKSSY